MIKYFENEYFVLKNNFNITNHSKNIEEPINLLIRFPIINENIIEKIKNKLIVSIIGKKETLILYENYEVELIECKNPSLAWSYLCKKNFPLAPKNIISITGTNGKTSSTWYTAQILTNLNIPNILINSNGIFINSVFVQNVENSTPNAFIIHKFLNEFTQNFGEESFAIIETTSIAIDQNRTAFINSKIGIWTNFTIDHLDYHNTKKNYFEAKMKLAKNCDKFLIHHSVNQKKHEKYGNELTHIKYLKNGMILNIKNNSKIIKVRTNLIGFFNAENIITVINALKSFFSLDTLKNQFQNLKNAAGRLEKYENIIIDYAHTIDGIKNLFIAVKSLKPKKIIAVIGFGGDRGRDRLNEISIFLNKKANNIILTTDNPRNEDPMQIALDAQKLCPNAIIILNRKEALAYAIKIANKSDIILAIGKGNENYQLLKNNTKEVYSEKETILQLLYSN